MRKMYSEKQIKNKALEAFSANQASDGQISVNTPIMFNEAIYDYNGEEILGGGGSGGTTLYKHIINGTGMFESDEDITYEFHFTVVLPLKMK